MTSGESMEPMEEVPLIYSVSQNWRKMNSNAAIAL